MNNNEPQIMSDTVSALASKVELRAIPPDYSGHDERRRVVEAVAAKLREVGWACDVVVAEPTH